MPDLIGQLKQLQTVDAERFSLLEQQERKPQELEEAQARLDEQQARVKAAEDRVKALQLSQKEKEGELQTKEGSVKKLQGQLFQVKTNREYTAMQHEIEALKADNSLLEEGILKIFDEIEAANKVKQQEQQRLAELQGQFKVEQARIDRELTAITERLTQLDRQRDEMRPAVPAKELQLYERILAMREGRAMVPLMKHACGGCHRRVPPQVVSEVHLKAGLVTCEHCNRILYYDENHSAL